MTNRDQAAATGVGAFLGTALALEFGPKSTSTGGGGTTIDLSGVIGELQVIEGSLGQLQATMQQLLTAIQGLGGGTSDVPTLQAILADLDLMIKTDQVNGVIDVITTTTGGTTQQLYVNPTRVRKALIQNISTDAVTLFTSSVGSSNGPQGVAGKGIILNPAAVSGQGGGSLPVLNEDLSEYWFSAATTSDKISVWYEV